MSRAVRLEADGTLKLAETDVTEQIITFLRFHGWLCVRTPATKIRLPSGQWTTIFPEGHPDWICARPIDYGHTDFFYLELKARRAKTAAHRKRAQAAFAADAEMAGMACYRAPDKHDDPFEHFQDWYAKLYGI